MTTEKRADSNRSAASKAEAIHRRQIRTVHSTMGFRA